MLVREGQGGRPVTQSAPQDAAKNTIRRKSTREVVGLSVR